MPGIGQLNISGRTASCSRLLLPLIIGWLCQIDSFVINHYLAYTHIKNLVKIYHLAAISKFPASWSYFIF